MLLLPDILLLLLPFAVLGADLSCGRRFGVNAGYRATWIGFAIVFLAQCLSPHDQSRIYLHRFEIAPWSLLMKQLFVLTGLVTTWLARSRGWVLKLTGRGVKPVPVAFHCSEFGVWALSLTFSRK